MTVTFTSFFLDPTIPNFIQFIFNAFPVVAAFFLGRSYERLVRIYKRRKSVTEK